MSSVRETESLIHLTRDSVTESYANIKSGNVRSNVESLNVSLSQLVEFTKRLEAHAHLDTPVSPDVQEEDTLYSPERVYETTEGAVLETSVQMPASGREFSIILDDSSVLIPELVATALIDKRYPVVMHLNIVEPAGDSNIQVDTAYIGEDDVRNPELYGVDVAEEDGVYTLTFPLNISCVDIIRSRGLLSPRTSMTRAYRTAASLTTLLPGKINRNVEEVDLQIEDEYVENAPYALFYIENGRDTYVVSDGDILLIKGKSAASSLSSGKYTVVTETVTYRGRAIVQGSEVAYTVDSSYMRDTALGEGDIIVNARGESAVVAQDGSLSRYIGSGSLIYSTQTRLKNSVSYVGDAPKGINVSGEIDNDKLVKIYDFTISAEDYIKKVSRCCREIGSMPVEYPIVTDLIRMHRKMGYDRAADLLSDLMIDEYLSVSESEASYESMLAEHTRTLQVKVLT